MFHIYACLQPVLSIADFQDADYDQWSLLFIIYKANEAGELRNCEPYYENL